MLDKIREKRKIIPCGRYWRSSSKLRKKKIMNIIYLSLYSYSSIEDASIQLGISAEDTLQVDVTIPTVPKHRLLLELNNKLNNVYKYK